MIRSRTNRRFPALTQRDVARAGREGPRLGAADRPRHDAGPDRERVGRRREVRRRGPVPVRSARQHRLERRRPETADGSRSARRNLLVGSLVAPVWPPTGGGSAMGNADERRQFVTQVRKACQIGAKLRASGIRKTASSESTPPRVPRSGRRIRPATRRRSPRPSARRARSRKSSANASPPKERSAGAACTAGSGTWSCSNRSIVRGLSAFRPTWPIRSCSRWDTTHPRIVCCPRSSTGQAARRSTMRCRG